MGRDFSYVCGIVSFNACVCGKPLGLFLVDLMNPPGRRDVAMQYSAIRPAVFLHYAVRRRPRAGRQIRCDAERGIGVYNKERPEDGLQTIGVQSLLPPAHALPAVLVSPRTRFEMSQAGAEPVRLTHDRGTRSFSITAILREKS
jgi:hypothetical protein